MIESIANIITRMRSSRSTIVAFYSLLALLILWELLLPGYVLTLDMVFTPTNKVADLFYGLQGPWVSDLPLLLFVSGISTVVPAWVVQKIILFLIVFVAGLSAHRLSPASTAIGKYYSGVLYALNPFVYARLMAGHWKILLAYAIMPLLIKVIMDFLVRQSLRNGAKLALLLSLTAIFSPSFLVLALIAFAVLLALKMVRQRHSTGDLLRLVGGTIIVALAFALINLYWLVPALTTNESVLTQMTSEDLTVFSAKAWGTGFNVVFSVASMHGFWRSGYTYISDILPGWYLIYAIILFLAVSGAVYRWNDKCQSLYVRGFVLFSLVALILAMGVSVPYISDLNQFLFDKLFLFKGMRDSQRFVALLVLAYSYLGGLGLSELHRALAPILEKIRLRRRKAVWAALSVIVLLLPILYSINLLGPFQRDLRAQDYPSDWYEVNDYLNSQEGDFNVIFFPWHGWMPFSWAGRTLMNPSQMFFDRPIIRGENIEVGSIYTQSTSPVQHYIQFLLDNSVQINKLGALLAPLNIGYVVLTKEADYRKYQFLFEQEDMEVVKDTPHLTVIRNTASGSRFYYVSHASAPILWQDLPEQVEIQGSLVDQLYPPSDTMAQEQLATSSFTPLAYKRLSPVHYELDVPSSGFAVFTAPFSMHWVLEGQRSTRNLGLTNAFHVSPGRVYLHFQRFNLLLTMYIVSGLSFLGISSFLFWIQLRHQHH